MRQNDEHLSPAYSLKLKNIILFMNRGLIFFSNGHICNVVLTLPNLAKIDVENDNVFRRCLTLLNSTSKYTTLFQRCCKVVERCKLQC